MKHSYFLRSAVYFIRQIKEILIRIYIAPVNRLRIFNYLKNHNVRKLHLGAGGNILKDWLNTDINPDVKTGVYLNAAKKFPFRDNTFDYIFSEHLIEHLDIRKGIFSLKECFRVLKPRGKIRISTPNLKYLIELYNPEKTEIQLQEIKRIVDMVYPDLKIYQDIFVINNFFRSWGHKFIYDHKLLKELLEKTGFADAVSCEIKKSYDENLQNLEAHGKFISEEINRLQTFIIEAKKPDNKI